MSTSVCELIDNAIDHWTARKRRNPVQIDLFLNVDRQLITVRDNAGGVPRDDIQLLVSPGASRDEVGFNFIGNFGVGGKRAGVALGQRVEVSSRYETNETFRFVLSDEWLAKDAWDVEVEHVNDINPGTTNVSISSLRQGFSHQDVETLQRHISEVYSKFIGNGCDIRVNGVSVGKTEFDVWAYPPEHKPKLSEFNIYPSDDQAVAVRITAGLLQDRNPIEENYGVYVYCNDRLIVAHEKSYEVGFYKGEAGVPHPDASLARTIVELSGPPELMPWTSSKSGLNWSHPTYLAIRDRIIALNTYFTKVSRRLKNVRDEQVFAHQTGEVDVIDLEGDGTAKRVVDLPLPRGRRKSYPDRLIEANAETIQKQPWTLGLVEAMGVADTISRKKIQTKNRLSLVILDSNLEIALKEFIVHRADLFRPDKYGDAKLLELFKRRHEVINLVKPHLSLDDVVWNKVRHYYDRRNKLVHERATVQITDVELEDYRAIVEQILGSLFNLKF
ncbi:ATP-binding protein [Ruegeria sp. ANG-R]|uniref:ATP-binding protein n=1 Tax=Ruegeria sp. ANG-R TaxID=1577903 RepID=UPI00187CCFD6|nr:ATP-binding protein [Ruegeria sp. ANG-R]